MLVKCYPLVSLIVVLLVLIGVWSVIEMSTWQFSLKNYEPEKFEAQMPPGLVNLLTPKLFEGAKVINSPNLRCPQDLAVDREGIIYTGLIDGRIVKIDLNQKITTILSIPNERIFGMILSKDESTLYFIAQVQGTMKLDLKTRKLEQLFNMYYGQMLVSLNNLALDEQNNKLYVTQSSTLIPMKLVYKEVLLKNALGKVFQFDLETKKLSVLIDKLYFPNGIVYEETTKTLLIAEMHHYQIIRVFLHGKKRGQKEVFMGNLHGSPDNMKLNENGDLLVAFPAVRNKILTILDRTPILRKVLIYLPEKIIFFFAKTTYAAGIKIDTRSGKVKEYMFGPNDPIKFVTTIVERNGTKYFSSLIQPTIVVVKARSQEQNKQNIELNQEEL